MNPHDDITARVHRELHEQADRITGSPVSLDDVKGTAGRIRRRRRAAVGAGVVAAALAILVPTTLLGSGLTEDSAPEPTGPVRALAETVLLTADAPEGPPPAVPYLDGDRLVADSNTVLEVFPGYHAVVPTGEEFLLVRHGDPQTKADVFSAGGIVESNPNTGMPVSSPDRSVAAWGTPSGEILTRSEGRTVRLATLPRPVQAVEIIGSGPCDAEGATCRVFFNESNRQLSPGVVDSSGVMEALPEELRSVSAVSEDSLVAGLTTDPDSDPAGRCSAMFDEPTGQKLFGTCDYAFDTATTGFSPDGSTIVAEEPDDYGAAPSVLALLDARSGEVRAEIRVPASEARAVGGVVDSHWEDDGHLLVKTEASAPDSDGYVYTVFRVGVEDGSVERLVRSDPAGGGPQPYILPN